MVVVFLAISPCAVPSLAAVRPLSLIVSRSSARRKIVFLDSNEVSLGMVDVDSSGVDVFYALQDADPSQAFLKGLCIVDDIAFFGIAPSSPRSSRADQGLECELAAYDLLNHKLLFRKRMPTNGLLNVVAAPQLAVRIHPSINFDVGCSLACLLDVIHLDHSSACSTPPPSFAHLNHPNRLT